MTLDKRLNLLITWTSLLGCLSVLGTWQLASFVNEQSKHESKEEATVLLMTWSHKSHCHVCHILSASITKHKRLHLFIFLKNDMSKVYWICLECIQWVSNISRKQNFGWFWVVIMGRKVF